MTMSLKNKMRVAIRQRPRIVGEPDIPEYALGNRERRRFARKLIRKLEKRAP